MYRECRLEHRRDAQIELGFLLDYEDLSIQEQARIAPFDSLRSHKAGRLAIVKALLQ